MMEVTGIAHKLISQTFRAVEIFIVAGAIYLVLNFLVTRAIMALEWWLSPHLRRAAARSTRASRPPMSDASPPAHLLAGRAVREPAQELRRARGAEGHLARGARGRRDLDPRRLRLRQVDDAALHQHARDPRPAGIASAARDQAEAGPPRRRGRRPRPGRPHPLARSRWSSRASISGPHMTVLENVIEAQSTSRKAMFSGLPWFSSRPLSSRTEKRERK